VGADERFQCSHLVHPDNLYVINDVITITGEDVRIIRTGPRSRIKQAVRTKPVFRSCGPGQYFAFHVIGAGNRNTIPDGGGLDLIRDNHPFANHCGVVFQYGADGGTTERITGFDIAIVVEVWGWSDVANDYAGTIHNLTNRNNHGEEVWCVVFGREFDGMVNSISGTCNRISTIFADPHGTYLTSSSYVGSLRSLNKINVGDLRCYDSFGGEPIDLKDLYGASVWGINVRNTPGIAVFQGLDNFTIGAYVADEIWKDPAQVGTANSPSGGQAGMVTFSECSAASSTRTSRSTNLTSPPSTPRKTALKTALSCTSTARTYQSFARR
jgi:hypothetical protein